MSDRAFTLISNFVLTFMGLVWAYLKYRDGNMDAVYTAVGGLIALWKHSGRSGSGAPASTLLLLVLPLLGLLGCYDDAEINLLRVKVGEQRPVAPQAQLAPMYQPSFAADFIQMATRASNPVPSGYAGIWVSNSDGKLRFVDTAGNSVKAGQATGLQISAGAPGSAVLGDCWIDSTASYKLYCKESAGNLAQRVDLTAPGPIGSVTPSTGAFTTLTTSGNTTLGDAIADLLALKGEVRIYNAAGTYYASLTNTVTANRAVTMPDAAGEVVLTTATQTLSSKTAYNVILTGTVTGTYTLGGTPTIPTSGLSGTVGKANGGTGEDNSTGGTANTFWARPNGSAGAATYRALVAADLPATAVTAGSYTSANITVDAQGRITAAANGSGGGSTAAFWDPVAIFASGTAGADGTYTMGSRWGIIADCKITGVQIRLYGTPSAQPNVFVWVNGTLSASKAATGIAASGAHTISFSSAVNLNAGDLIEVGWINGTDDHYASNSTIASAYGHSPGGLYAVAINNSYGGNSYYGGGSSVGSPTRPTSAYNGGYAAKPILEAR